MTAEHAIREDLRKELAANRAAFRHILDGLSDDDWRRRTGDTVWTVGQLLYHLVWNLESLPREVARARRGQGMYNLPLFLRDPLNAAAMRLGALGQSRGKIAGRYEAAYARALRSLDDVGEDEWRHGARFYGVGFFDVEGLFRARSHHLAEHAADIAAALGQRSTAEGCSGESQGVEAS